MKYFGTDGIRGQVGKFPITVDFILKLGWAIGKVLGTPDDGRMLIGKDTRLSGYMFESALQAGLASAGVDVYLLGPLPTPAIAYLTRTFRAQVGIVISASHNHYLDNGIKFFSDKGLKLDAHIEQSIEDALSQELQMVPGNKIGKVYRLKDASGRYIEYCKAQVPHLTNFKGLKIIMDCANGATYSVAPQIFRELDAHVLAINVWPNGMNINLRCGSLHLQQLRKYVIKEGADLGIAFDGDGDRMIMVDHTGEEVDGDEILYIIARNLHASGRLRGKVIGTQMSNLGLEAALSKIGIPFERTQVGDHHVLSKLITNDWSVGGEPSGHIMCMDNSTTADGIIAALQVLTAMKSNNCSLREIKKPMHKFPQIIENIPSRNPAGVVQDERVASQQKAAEEQLAGKGRIVIRASGTEPLIRVMVEGEDLSLVQRLSKELAVFIQKIA